MKIQKFIKEHVNYAIIISAVLVAIGFISIAHLIEDTIWSNVFASAGAGSITIIPTILIVDGLRKTSLKLRLQENQAVSIRRVQQSHFKLVSKLILDIGSDISIEDESRHAIAEALTTPGAVSKKYWYIALRAILSTDPVTVKNSISAERLQNTYLPAFVVILEKLEITLMQYPAYEDLGITPTEISDLIIKAEEVITMIESIEISTQMYDENEIDLKAKQAHSQEVINSLLEYLELYRHTTYHKDIK